MVQNVVLVFLRRRLSQRPNVEELESRNILKREFQKIRLPAAASKMCNSSVHAKARKWAGWCIRESAVSIIQQQNA